MAELERAEWYVVHAKPRKEEFAQYNLKRKGVTVFLPQLLLPGFPESFRRIVPLFPGYLFVRIRFFEEYHYVIWSPGVKRLLIFNGSPASLGDDIVSFLMEQATPEGIITAHSNLRAGQMVQVDGGPFDGLSGIIQEPPNARGRVKILLSLLKRQVKVEVPARYVKSGWVTNPPKPAAQTRSSNLRPT